MTPRIYLSLGSNMGDARANLQAGIDQLRAHPAITVQEISSVYETQPWGNLAQANFNNIAVVITTTLTPAKLLALIHTIEANLHRQCTIHWGPRTLDIDIIYWGELVINTPTLIIPHPQAFKRNFVLLPIETIAQNDSKVLPQVQAALKHHEDTSWIKNLGDL